MTGKYTESQIIAFDILQQYGERLPREFVPGNTNLTSNLNEMASTLERTSDEAILNIRDSNKRARDEVLLKLYAKLIVLQNELSPNKIPDISLRMLEITISNGLCSMSSLAFAQFAMTLAGLKKHNLAYRLGKLALRLIVRTNAHQHTSAVVVFSSLVCWIT